jgi:hypothetical protein
MSHQLRPLRMGEYKRNVLFYYTTQQLFDPSSEFHTATRLLSITAGHKMRTRRGSRRKKKRKKVKECKGIKWRYRKRR